MTMGLEEFNLDVRAKDAMGTIKDTLASRLFRELETPSLFDSAQPPSSTPRYETLTTLNGCLREPPSSNRVSSHLSASG